MRGAGAFHRLTTDTWRRPVLVLLALGVLAGVAVGFAVTAGPAASSNSTGELYQMLANPDPSLPAVVATVNGQPVLFARYWTAYTIFKTNLDRDCPVASTLRPLGPANVALSRAVDDVLVMQYGQAHGVTVSDTDIHTALGQKARMEQEALASGGDPAAGAREDLASTGLSAPAQILSSPAWQQRMRDGILWGKTVQAFVKDKLPAQQRGGPGWLTALADFEAQLRRTAAVKIFIPAHLLDPHQYSVNIACPPPSSPAR